MMSTATGFGMRIEISPPKLAGTVYNKRLGLLAIFAATM